MDYYGRAFSYIHLKFGDMRKMYFFTDEFIKAHPIFCAEYRKYWDRDPKCRFENPMQIINYVEHWNIPVKFYFNFTDTPAKDYQDVKEYLMRECVPSPFGEWVDGENGERAYVGWDGEKREEDAVC